jgi:hypothetical protein
VIDVGARAIRQTLTDQGLVVQSCVLEVCFKNIGFKAGWFGSLLLANGELVRVGEKATVADIRQSSDLQRFR